MASERQGRVWEEVRRALGRLAGRVHTHSFPESEASITAAVRLSQATVFSSPIPGGKEAESQVPATVRGLSPPEALPGGEGVDLASVLTVIGANRALTGSEPAVRHEPCAVGPARVCTWGISQDGPPTSATQSAPVRLEFGTVVAAPMRWAAPTVHALSAPAVALSPPRRGPGPAWKIPPTRVKSSLVSALRVPLICDCLNPGATGLQALLPERRLLAAASGVLEADTLLIGVFPHVPLGAVQRLSMSPDGRGLEVWLKPEAAGRMAVHKTVTVVLGRQRSTGRILQTVRLSGGDR